MSANQTTLYTQAPASQIGTASGLLRTFGYIGSIASSAIIAIGSHGGVNDAHLHSIALVMVIVSLLGVVVVVVDRAVMSQVRAAGPRRPSTADDPEGAPRESPNRRRCRSRPGSLPKPLRTTPDERRQP